MPLFSQPNPSDRSSNRSTPPVSSEILVSLATAPLLMGLLGGKVLTELMCEIGQASEEIFRGDRLPVLNLPHHPSTTANSEFPID